MSRTVERVIDLIAMLMLLAFTYLFRESQPALAGLVVGAAISFWMSKNASSPESAHNKETAAAIEAAAAQSVVAASTATAQAAAAATAAAQVLQTAASLAATQAPQPKSGRPDEQS